MPVERTHTGDVEGEVDQAGDATAFLQAIEQDPPFDASGRLRGDTAALLRTLDPGGLGSAVTILLRQAVALSPVSGAGVAAALETVLDDGGAGDLPIELEIPALVTIYRGLMRDPSRQEINAFIVRLLRDTDRAAIFASLGVDAGSLDVRARLGAALDAAAPEAEPIVRTRGLRRGGARAEPPAPMPPTRGIDGPVVGVEAMEVQGGLVGVNLEGIDLEGLGMGPGAGGGGISGLGAAPEAAAERDLAAAPVVQRRTYRAYGLLESDETVLVARPFELKVGLSPSSPPGVAGPPLELPKPDAASYALDIQLFADGFDLAKGESWRNSLIVSAGDLFPSVVVHLTARDLPEPREERSLTATFSIAGETLGAAIRKIIVTTDPADPGLEAATPTASGTNITAPTGDPAADITITIKRGLDAGKLLWGVESTLAGVELGHDHPAEGDIGEDPKDFAVAIIHKLFVQGDQPGIFQLLQGIGRRIRDKMPPTVHDALKAANAAVTPRPLDILLLTEEPYVPWELAWVDEPFDAKAPQYLGAQANIGRWVLDGGATPTDPPRHVDASTMAVVWGVYESAGLPRLLAAEEEAKKIQATYQAVSVDARPNPVYDLLGGTPPSDILHFAVHGRYNPQGADEGIYLVEGPPIDDLKVLGSNLKDRAPFVFLNACQVGAAQNLLGSYAGIAQAFLEIGASGVVAPLWSIDDEVAQGIALAFYAQALAPGVAANGGAAQEPPAVADLLRKARAGLVTDAATHSATYLAYQFYGHPSLRLSWKQAVPAGGQAHG